MPDDDLENFEADLKKRQERILHSRVSQLAEHFDSVTIIATTYCSQTGTGMHAMGEGNPNARRLFRVTDNVNEAGGADSMADLGEDKYFAHVDKASGNKLGQALETAHASNDPEVKFLAHVHDNLPKGGGKFDTLKAGGLRVGDEFKVNGEKFRVAEDDQGYRVLQNHEYGDVPVDALNHVPADQGTFKPGKRAKVSDGIPFSATEFEPQSEAPMEIIAASVDGVILCASTGSGEPALVIGQGLPTQIDGQPCHYRRKEIARVGKYVHRGRRKLDASGNPTEQWEDFEITPGRLDQWKSAFTQRKAAGIRPFVPEKHVGGPSDARANFGYMIDADRQGDKLYGTFQLIGDDALKAAARNDVSVYVIGPAADAKGGTYPECIEHVCLTPNPVIPDLEPFQKLAASADSGAITRNVPVFVLSAHPSKGVSIMACTPEECSAIKDHLSSMGEKATADSLTPETAVTGLISHHRGMMSKYKPALGLSADAPDAKVPETIVSLKTELDTAKTSLTKAQTDLAAKGQEVIALSASAIKRPDAITIAMYAEVTSGKREIAMGKGVTPAQAALIDQLVVDAANQPTPLALSACGPEKRPFGFVIWDTVAKIFETDPLLTGNQVPRTAAPAVKIAASADAKDAEKPMTDDRRKQLLGTIDLEPLKK